MGNSPIGNRYSVKGFKGDTQKGVKPHQWKQTINWFGLFSKRLNPLKILPNFF